MKVEARMEEAVYIDTKEKATMVYIVFKGELAKKLLGEEITVDVENSYSSVRIELDIEQDD